MQCRIVCLSRWPIFLSFFEFQRNPCDFYLDTCLFQFTLFLIDYLLSQTLLSLVSTSLQPKSIYSYSVIACSFSTIYFGFPGQTSLLANESAVLNSKSDATLIHLMFFAQRDPTPLQTSGAPKPLSYLHVVPDSLKYFPLLSSIPCLSQVIRFYYHG